QESEKKFRLIADITPEMIWVTDAEGKVEFLNRQWYNFSGTEPGQKTASEVAEKSIHPEDAPKVMEAFANAIKTGKQFAISQRNRRADGKYRRFLNRGVPYHDPETGEITKWYGISTDIEDLKSAEERYRLLVESIDAGFCIIKMVYNEEGNPIDYVFVDHNPAFAMHIPLPDPIGRSMLEMVPDHENYWLDLYSEVDKTGESVRYENHAQALDRYYSGFAFSIESDEGLVGVLFEDITHKRKVEEQIKNSEERLRLASDAAGLGTYEYDVYRDKFIWSPEVYKLYDVTQDAEPTKEIIHERIHPDDFVRFEKSVANTLSTRSDEINKNIYRIKTRKGAIRWVRDVNKAFYSEEDNQVVRIIGTIHDITETKLAEEALHETAQRKDEFLAMLAHELRNPLSPMKSAIDLMRTGSNEEEEVKARDIIERQVDKLIRLIDDLMDISRISKNRIKLQQRGMDLREALEVAIETAAPLIKERRHQFKADLPDVPVPIRADLDRLIQVITNLLTNAAKYTPEGGRISVKLKTENEQALIEVEDNGVGISGEDKTVIFEIFRQVGNQNSGLGIGLSLVKTLVEMHRGEVSVRSEGRDRGSTFTISLPLNERDFALKSDNNVQKTIEGNPEKEKLRILVVDDNKDGADLLQMALSRKGFEVEKTYTGGEGVSKAIEFHPQVALLDIGLPDISGYEVAKQLRKHFPNMVLIAHSGWGQAKDRERALEAGFDHHLIKPVNVSKIVELLQVK
ncbi:MAG TPA: PAS domain-containing protein, partial [Cryomorphaceae bacterium]|nr:PAS domain-containing protein [Cryomorphaceae bacterium]